MYSLFVDEVFLTKERYDPKKKESYKDLLLLYRDGTWERVFRLELPQDTTVIGKGSLRPRTREEALARLVNLYYDDEIKGEFLIKV